MGHELLSALPEEQTLVVRSFILGFGFAALIALSAVALAIGLMSGRETVEVVDPRRGKQQLPAPEQSASRDIGLAKRIADPRKAELLKAALEAVEDSPIDPLLRAAASTKYHNRLLTAAACSSHGLADVVTLCSMMPVARRHNRSRTATIRHPKDEAAARAEAARQLDGTWKGNSFFLRVDITRLQANTDASRPFQWHRCLISEVLDGKITFTINAEVFQAAIQEDALALSSTSFRGERTLHRMQSP